MLSVQPTMNSPELGNPISLTSPYFLCRPRLFYFNVLVCIIIPSYALHLFAGLFISFKIRTFQIAPTYHYFLAVTIASFMSKCSYYCFPDVLFNSWLVSEYIVLALVNTWLWNAASCTYIHTIYPDKHVLLPPTTTTHTLVRNINCWDLS